MKKLLVGHDNKPQDLGTIKDYKGDTMPAYVFSHILEILYTPSPGANRDSNLVITTAIVNVYKKFVSIG